MGSWFEIWELFKKRGFGPGFAVLAIGGMFFGVTVAYGVVPWSRVCVAIMYTHFFGRGRPRIVVCQGNCSGKAGSCSSRSIWPDVRPDAGMWSSLRSPLYLLYYCKPGVTGFTHCRKQAGRFNHMWPLCQIPGSALGGRRLAACGTLAVQETNFVNSPWHAICGAVPLA